MSDEHEKFLEDKITGAEEEIASLRAELAEAEARAEAAEKRVKDLESRFAAVMRTMDFIYREAYSCDRTWSEIVDLVNQARIVYDRDKSALDAHAEGK